MAQSALAPSKSSWRDLLRLYLYIARYYNHDVLAISLTQGTLLEGAAADPNANKDAGSLTFKALSVLAADGGYLYAGALPSTLCCGIRRG